MGTPVGDNPNASLTTAAEAITILLVLGRGMVGLAASAEVASAFTTVAAAIIL